MMLSSKWSYLGCAVTADAAAVVHQAVTLAELYYHITPQSVPDAQLNASYTYAALAIEASACGAHRLPQTAVATRTLAVIRLLKQQHRTTDVCRQLAQANANVHCA
eukprot:16250-Heterococcus_DN1.PRE.2